MEEVYRETVETSTDKENGDNSIPRKCLLRQVFVCSGIWVNYFAAGLSFGSPTVFIPQIRREANSSDVISIEMASWLSSTFNYSGVVSCVILLVMARFIGRKLTFITMCITTLMANILLYFSSTIIQILLSEIIHGPLICCPVTLGIMVLTEYTTPRYRGVFLTFKSATLLCGIWAANAIGTFMYWKNIVILEFICCLYCLISASFWPKSPYWLIYKNRFEDGAISQRWLKGRTTESESELEQLIRSKKYSQTTPGESFNIFKKILIMFRTKTFYRPIILATFVMSLYHLSGKIACGMYAIDIIKRITGTESTAYTGMLILDGITVLGMYVGCGLSKFLKRRTLLLVSSAIGAIFLFFISLYLYLIHFEVIVENTIISISLLMGYSLTISVGPMIMATTILGELFPVKYRNSSVLVAGCIANLIMGSVIKISPFIFSCFGVRGLFSFFFVSVTVLTVINYKVLPETKDKTILEIQEELLAKKSLIKPIDKEIY